MKEKKEGKKGRGEKDWFKKKEGEKERGRKRGRKRKRGKKEIVPYFKSTHNACITTDKTRE